MLKLYYNPGSCSLASHAALIEAGLDFEIEWVDLTRDEQLTPAFRAKNPWGRVPALDVNGEILTENLAILTYIAQLVPERGLLPREGWAAVRALEWMALLSNTVHVAFRPIFRPGRSARTEAGQADVKATGIETLNAVLTQVEARLGDRPYALGDSFSLCDLYLFVFVMWSQRLTLKDAIGPLPGLLAFGDRLAARPSMSQALAAERLAWA